MSVAFSLEYILLLIGTGILAGVINTLAGGGSNLTIPALMIMGMPPEIANATNRVGVFLQCFVGSWGFKRNNRLDTIDVVPVVIPTLIGGVIGALAASFSPSWVLKPMLLGAMVTMALIILISPSTVLPPEGTPRRDVRKTPTAWLALFVAGIYGGFVQAGVGFILIAALAGSLRYDLVRANALKLVCSLAFTGLALVVFIWRDQILWLPGLTLALGAMLGTTIAIKLAVNVKQTVLKWFLFVMTLLASAAAIWL